MNANKGIDMGKSYTNKGNKKKSGQSASNVISPFSYVTTTEKKGINKADTESGPLHTGYFTCRLFIKTPLIIPDASSRIVQDEHSTFSFMEIDGQNLIPGSSLRGVIRSVYETLTDSCLVTSRLKAADSEEEKQRLGEVGYDRKGDKGQSAPESDTVYIPCVDRTQACPACRLFGMGSAAGSGAVSKVRFTDAILQGTMETQILTLDELMSPKDKEERKPDRKFYYHHKPKSQSDNEKKQVNSTMEKIEEGEASFRVYYDGISDEQRRQLLWTLCLGENKADGHICHKIGHGKPLGFGSVKIIVESYTERTYGGSDYVLKSSELLGALRYQKAFDLNDPNDKKMQRLKNMLDFNYVKNNNKTVKYKKDNDK